MVKVYTVIYVSLLLYFNLKTNKIFSFIIIRLNCENKYLFNLIIIKVKIKFIFSFLIKRRKKSCDYKKWHRYF
jgi:hypothetical protein